MRRYRLLTLLCLAMFTFVSAGFSNRSTAEDREPSISKYLLANKIEFVPRPSTTTGVVPLIWSATSPQADDSCAEITYEGVGNLSTIPGFDGSQQ